MDEKPRLEPMGIFLISLFFLLLTYAGYISYKSIDWDVLKRIESQQLVLPTQVPESIGSATPSLRPTIPTITK